MAAINGTAMDGSAACSVVDKLDEQSQQQPDGDTIKMFVGQIPRSWDEARCRQLFEQYGPVHQLNVLRDKQSQLSRGCCFVTYYHRKDAIAAQNALHNVQMLDGMHHAVQMKPADSENRNERKLFIGMLNKKLNEEEVKEMFQAFGVVEDCSVLRDGEGKSRGLFGPYICCAFVTFSSRSSAQQAIRQMHHSRTMEGCSLPLVVKFADTQKDKETKKLQHVQPSTAGLQLTNSNANSGAGDGGLSSYMTLVQQQLSSPAGQQQLGGLLNSLPQLAVLAGLLSGQNISQPQQQQSQNPLLGLLGAALACSAGPTQNQNQLAAEHLSLLDAQSTPLLATGLNTLSLSFGNPTAVSASFESLCGLLAANDSTRRLATTAHCYTTGSAGGGSGGAGTNLIQLTGGAQSSMLVQHPQISAYDALQTVYSRQPIANPGSAGLVSLAQQAVEAKQTEGPTGANLFIYHLPQEFADQDLAQTFAPFGTVLSAKVFVDKQTNLSKCFGFVSFDNAKSAQQAILAMNGFQIAGKRLKVQVKKPKPTPYQKTLASASIM